MLERSLNFIIKKLAQLSAIVMGVMILYITVHALLRYTIGRGLPSTYPLIQNLMVIVVFFALAQAQVEKQHIRITFLTDRLSGKLGTALDYLVYLVAVVFLFGMLWGGKVSFQESLSIKEYFAGSIRIPVYPARLAVVIGSAFILIRVIFDLIQKISGSTPK
jgi:TRAP-type C4-dicarboxylate transport system permease small subunit